MSEDEQKVRFVCPICKSEYEAEYSEVTGIIPNQKVIMLVEEPKLTYLGTRIASS
jgi:hypothetical protein